MMLCDVCIFEFKVLQVLVYAVVTCGSILYGAMCSVNQRAGASSLCRQTYIKLRLVSGCKLIAKPAEATYE
jgi:hypothetical protein